MGLDDYDWQCEGLGKVGGGTYGVVLKAEKEQKRGKYYAIKVLIKTQ